MENLSFHLSKVVEFQPKERYILKDNAKMVNQCTQCEPVKKRMIDATMSTPGRNHQEIQTESPQALTFISEKDDDQRLLMWLRKIMPMMEKELDKGCAPIVPLVLPQRNLSLNIQQSQKISWNIAEENSILLSACLSTRINSISALLICSVPTHASWCEHFNQSIRVFTPQKIPSVKVSFVEDKSLQISLNSCLRNLRVNSHQRSIFFGSTYTCDIYIWRFESYTNYKRSAIREIGRATFLYGIVNDMDWLDESSFLTVHTNGRIVKWQLIGNSLTEQQSYFLKHPLYIQDDISNLMIINLNTFIIGTTKGLVLHCSMNEYQKQFTISKVTLMSNHSFAVTSLFKYRCNHEVIAVSCDISGQLYYYNMTILNNEPMKVMQLPLPFNMAIHCLNDGTLIYYSDKVGSFGCYNLKLGHASLIQSTSSDAKGFNAGRGGNISYNDLIVLGPFKNYIQIFFIEFDK